MRKLSLFIITLVLALPLAVLTLVILAVEDHPRVDRRVILTPEHMERAKQIVDAHRDWVRPGMLASARIMPADADLAANYLANRFGKGSAQLALADRNAVIRLSLPLNGYPLDGYLNLEATLDRNNRAPATSVGEYRETLAA